MGREHAVNLPEQGEVPGPAPAGGDWNPAEGDQYLPSLYFENEDGVTEAVVAAEEADYGLKVEFMDKLIAHLSRAGVTLADPETDEFEIDSDAVKAIVKFFKDRPVEA